MTHPCGEEATRCRNSLYPKPAIACKIPSNSSTDHTQPLSGTQASTLSKPIIPPSASCIWNSRIPFIDHPSIQRLRNTTTTGAASRIFIPAMLMRIVMVLRPSVVSEFDVPHRLAICIKLPSLSVRGIPLADLHPKLRVWITGGRRVRSWLTGPGVPRELPVRKTPRRTAVAVVYQYRRIAREHIVRVLRTPPSPALSQVIGGFVLRWRPWLCPGVRACCRHYCRQRSTPPGEFQEFRMRVKRLRRAG